MAKKGAAKGTAGYDYCALSPEQKAKVQALSETYPEASKDHIAIVLQYYNFDQDKATDALTTDGGTTALNNWNITENSQTKVANKNKKKNKKKNRKDNGGIVGVAALATDGDAEDSSSLHSSNIDFDGEKEHAAKPDLDNEMTEKADEDVLSMCNSVVSSSCERQAFVDRGECNASGGRVETPEESKSDDGLLPSLDVDSIENSVAEKVERLSLKGAAEEHSRHYSSKHTYNRQRYGSYRHSKSSMSEDNNASAMQTSNAMKNRSYVKSQKDLNRQSVSLQNILLKVENKLDEAGKCIKNTFAEIRSMLDKRQNELESQVANVKQEALALLTGRLNLATDLKLRVERSSTDPNFEWLDLRADIKQFVTERKYDDEFSKTIWFQWSMDDIIEDIKKFGEVAPVKNNYSQRNSVSRNQSSPELSQHDLDSKTDDGLPQEPADLESFVGGSSHDAGEVKVEKEASVKFCQGENRPRVFSNQKYRQQNNYRGFIPNHNRGRGFYNMGRGNSGGYRGGRFDNYPTYRQFGGAERYDYRQQQYSQDKPDYHHVPVEEKTAETGVPHINDSNNASAAFSSNPRERQQQQQQQQQHYRYPRNQNRRSYGNRYNGPRAFNYGQNRIPHKPQRGNSETITSTGDNVGNNTNYDQAHQEKQDVINGF